MNLPDHPSQPPTLPPADGGGVRAPSASGVGTQTGHSNPDAETALGIGPSSSFPKSGASSKDSVPSQFGPYKIMELLGEGGMGVVYKAQHEVLDRTVALKIIRTEMALDTSFCDRFLREARLAAAVEHANVVTIYDAGNLEGHLYMALRYVQGGDLANMVRTQGPIPESLALPIMRDCARGLQAIHEAGLIHRDIKPANILLEHSGLARIADLGLARPTQKNTKDEGLTLHGAPVGTPSYMSPEQVQGASDVDIRADIYSLGVTMYAIVTGRVPFTGSSVYETLANVLHKEPPDPRTVMPSLSEETSVAILKALRKDRKDRQQTPSEFLKEIEGIMSPGNKVSVPVAQSTVPLAAITGDTLDLSAWLEAASPLPQSAPLREPSGAPIRPGSSSGVLPPMSIEPSGAKLLAPTPMPPPAVDRPITPTPQPAPRPSGENRLPERTPAPASAKGKNQGGVISAWVHGMLFGGAKGKDRTPTPPPDKKKEP